jgi:hypothetical protein
METITNLISGIDNNIGSVLDNRYLFITLVVLTILFGSLAHSRLTSVLLSLFDSPLTRLFLLGSLYYISTKNVSLAILMLTAMVITMNTQNKFRFNYLLLSLFRRSHSPRFMSHRGTPRSSVRSMGRLRSSERVKQMKLRKLRQIYLNQILNQLAKAIKKAQSRRKKLSKKYKKAAKKAKKIARSIGQTTPKIVKKIVKSTPKLADPKLVPSVVVDRLLSQKKISSDEASKLRSIKTSSILELLKSREISSLNSSEKSKSATPQISISSPATTPKTLTPKTLTPKTESTITSKSVASTPKTQIIFPQQSAKKSEKFDNFLDKYFNI